MNLEKQNTWSGQKKLIFIIFLCFAFSVTGCKSSEEKRKELIREKEIKVKILSVQISEKHNVISFPPKGLGASAFTYELQKFLSANAERGILFKGYLEDIEKTERGIVVEFLCPLGENFYINKTAIRLRLTVVEEKVKQFLAVKQRGDPMFRSLRYLNEPHYFIIAKITGPNISERYKFGDPDRGNEFASTGKLVEAIPIPNN